MDEEKLHQQVLLACDKHELRGETKEKVLSWVQDSLVRYGLLKNLEMGLVEICGVNEDDADILFKLTDAGREYAEKMAKE